MIQMPLTAKKADYIVVEKPSIYMYLFSRLDFLLTFYGF